MPTTDIKERVAQIIASEVVPLLQMDGGSVEVVNVQDGVVQVRLHGTCASCPSVTYAVIMGVEQELRKRVPEVEYLEAVP